MQSPQEYLICIDAHSKFSYAQHHNKKTFTTYKPLKIPTASKQHFISFQPKTHYIYSYNHITLFLMFPYNSLIVYICTTLLIHLQQQNYWDWAPKSKTWCNKVKLDCPLTISFMYWHWFEHLVFIFYIVYDFGAFKVA